MLSPSPPPSNLIPPSQINQTPHQALQAYQHLLILHNGPNFSKLVFAPLLKACSKSSSLHTGQQIHAQTIKLGLSPDVFVQTALVSLYSSSRHPELARKVFDKMPHRNVVTWTTMMGSLLKLDKPELVLLAFRDMQENGVLPDRFAVVSVLTACARVGALGLGKCVHGYVGRVGMEMSAFVGTALIDMYCKCGCVEEGLRVFEAMEKRSVKCWNAMLHGLAVHGRGEEAMALFKEMEMDGGVRPNVVTFVGVLCGCSHSGLVEEGRFYFDLMQRKYGIDATVKHYGCMVDLLGRAGLLREAFETIENMRVPPNAVVWGSLLAACKARNNLEMAERVMKRIIEIEENGPQGDTSHYVIMSNMYAQVGCQDKMAEARKKVGNKPKGWSSIEIEGHVHRFSVGDTSHPMWGKTKEMLDEVRRKVGCAHGETEDFLVPHSEKVAVAFGLLSTSSPTPIRIIKNLRICEDCHEMMKSVSKVYEREINVRDCTRFHRFSRGVCSCKDYW